MCSPAGALGTLVSRWLLQQRVCHLALASRSGTFPADSATALLAPHYSSAIILVKADTSFASDTAAAFMGAAPAVSGIVHAGGVLADATVANQTLAGIRQVCGMLLAARAAAKSKGRINHRQRPCAMPVTGVCAQGQRLASGSQQDPQSAGAYKRSVFICGCPAGLGWPAQL